MIHITVVVVACNKDHGLFGIDVLKVKIAIFIDSIKAEENNRIIKILQGENSFKGKPSLNLFRI